MTTVARNLRALSPDAFWRARNRELALQFTALCERVTEAQGAGEAVKAMWGHAFTGSREWLAAADTAKRLVTNAKRQKTRVRKLCADDLDTLRIRTAYIAACPSEHKELIERVRQYIQVLEALGL